MGLYEVVAVIVIIPIIASKILLVVLFRPGQPTVSKRCKYHGFGGPAHQNIINTMCFGKFHKNKAKI